METLLLGLLVACATPDGECQSVRVTDEATAIYVCGYVPEKVAWDNDLVGKDMEFTESYMGETYHVFADVLCDEM